MSTTVPRHLALALLSECVGDEIWSVDHCRLRRVPESWIDDMSDAFESGFDSDDQTIYVRQHQVNQYHGIRDVDLAVRLGRELGLDVQQVTAMALNSRSIVAAIKESLME